LADHIDYAWIRIVCKIVVLVCSDLPDEHVVFLLHGFGIFMNVY